MVVIEDAELRMERVCAPLRYHPCATVTKVVGTTNFPPSFAAAGYAAGFRGFGPPPGARSPAGSRDADDARPAFVERASIFPDPPRGAFQHVAVIKNFHVAAHRDASARLHVFDVRDWSEKQVIRVGELDPPGPVDGAAAPPSLVPAAVSALAFDGTTIAVGTHEGLLHTWRLAEREGKRGYARLLQPLKVDAGAVVRAHLAPDRRLLTAYSADKRTFVCWELDTGKLRGAFCVDGVAKGAPLVLTADAGSVIACAHASAVDSSFGTTSADAESEHVVALLDVDTGEGGRVRGCEAALANEGAPLCLAFDGQRPAGGTCEGAGVAWAAPRAPTRGNGGIPGAIARRGAKRRSARRRSSRARTLPGNLGCSRAPRTGPSCCGTMRGASWRFWRRATRRRRRARRRRAPPAWGRRAGTWRCSR